MDIPQIDLAATGTNIRRMRKARGISVVEISEKLMIDKQAVYRWEYGKSLPQLENCLALARMFHTTIEDILIEKGETVSSLPFIKPVVELSAGSSAFKRFFHGSDIFTDIWRRILPVLRDDPDDGRAHDRPVGNRSHGCCLLRPADAEANGTGNIRFAADDLYDRCKVRADLIPNPCHTKAGNNINESFRILCNGSHAVFRGRCDQ